MTADGGLNVILGAGEQAYDGWIATQEDDLRLHVRADWVARFAPASIDRLLAEHVWEHLAPDEAALAAGICHEFLRPGGRLRVAVPDGLLPDEEYQRTVQVGGPGPEDHPAASHKALYDYRTIAIPFRQAGFNVRLLEWWDVSGVFHAEAWDEREGFIYRSARFDHRNREGRLGFTSLIIDAIKPRA